MKLDFSAVRVLDSQDDAALYGSLDAEWTVPARRYDALHETPQNRRCAGTRNFPNEYLHPTFRTVAFVII